MSYLASQTELTPRYGRRLSRSRAARSASNSPVFTTHRLTRRYPAQLKMPDAGVLHLWRFRASWLPVAIHESEKWLSDAERNRARFHPNAALRHRYIASRVMLRWIGANLTGLPPREVQIVDGHGEHRGAQIVVGDRCLSVDIAFGGIWVLIGIGPSTLGLGITMPRPGSETSGAEDLARASVWEFAQASTRRQQEDASRRHADALRRTARHTSLSGAMRVEDATAAGDDLDELDEDSPAVWIDLADEGRWHVIDVPMPGEIRGAISVAQPVRQIHAVGWIGP
ncbi:hypothetical protein G3N59_35325 [Paraburkholderia sp. Ac-20340]|uniref:hypothetical protein n=1 Tax=Paraburkholderia sp. Ac-20340 TaxID=2703888 RepID=UPI0019806CD3|nr:hypothetical protein [Paraburkholderia sp. Ac-20340]MBN3858676.1 hypothetical protein [Paraburkholderia sp. Ac-20340]